MKKFLILLLNLIIGATLLFAGENEKFAKRTKYEIAVVFIFNLDRPTLVDVDGLAVPIWNADDKENTHIGEGQAMAIGMRQGEHTIQLYTTDYVLYKSINIQVSSNWQYHYNVSSNKYVSWDNLISWIQPYFLRPGGKSNAFLHSPPEYYKYAEKRIINSQDKKEKIESPTHKKALLASVVDKDIPSSRTKSEDTYVLIIANEDYENLSPVTYATHDGEVFKQYCTQTLGVPERQIRYCSNASYGNMVGAIDWLKYALNNFEGAKGIVYYCGHGIPDEKTGQAFLMPVDGKGTNMTTCYSLNTLYKTLANTKAQSITYFMDACFTGANKEGSMLVAARGVARAPEKEVLTGKTVVFSASSGDETAMTLEEQGHGLFTYYLLKKLQETEGNVTYGELADYINQNVKKDAFLINEKPQTPVVATSPAVVNTWRNMKLK